MSDAAVDPGELTRLESWFRGNIGEFSGSLSLSLITGGRSNLTYDAADAGGRRWILRRPPRGDLLPRAHDVGREHRILQALGRAGFPVPAVHALCTDPVVFGAPFVVMEHVDGLVVRDANDAERMLAPEGRSAVGGALVTTLARLHAETPAELGLGDLGPGSGYLERQLRRWHSQYLASRGEVDIPEVAHAHELLCQGAPPSSEVVVVHGDFKLDNALIDRCGVVKAVLDWELCTLGDPLADLGSMLAYWEEAGEEQFTDAPATASPGFATRRALAAAYAEVSGRSVRDIDYYLALGYWKIACISMGVYARYASGAMADDGYDYTDAPRRIRLLAGKAVAAATSWQAANERTPS